MWLPNSKKQIWTPILLEVNDLILDRAFYYNRFGRGVGILCNDAVLPFLGPCLLLPPILSHQRSLEHSFEVEVTPLE